MSINNVNGVSATNAYQGYAQTATVSEAKTENVAASAAESTGVVYEPSNEASTKVESKTYTPNTELINKLKADAEARTSQLRSIVEQLISKQANAYGAANNIWEFLASGKYTVDPATQAQAQADIAEDGYWGVEQTSDRIVDFATALTGGDPDKIEEMRDAFIKGYKQAADTWGGKLPDISQQTYDAVMEKFDKLAEEAGLTTKINE